MGRNGQVVGDTHYYGDYQYTKEAVRIIREHDTTIPLFYYIAFQVRPLALFGRLRARFW